jgi:hypothetical protein
MPENLLTKALKAVFPSVFAVVEANEHNAVVDAAMRLNPSLKVDARKLRISKAKELGQIANTRKSLAVQEDEALKAKAAAELLLK